MVEKQTGMSEEGSAGRDVTDCGLQVKGREAERQVSDWPNKEQAQSTWPLAVFDFPEDACCLR